MKTAIEHRSDPPTGSGTGTASQFAQPGHPTLAHVIVIISDDAGLTKAQRTRAIRDIKTTCKWFDMDAADVIAHPMNIRPRFARLSPGGLGVTTKRIQNVRSSLKSSLTRAGLTSGRSFKVPLTPDWERLLGRIADTYRKEKVRCIARFASARGVAPTSVDNAFSAELLVALSADRLHSSPRITHQNAVRAWSSLADTIDGWPRQKLTVPRYRKQKSPDVSPHPNLVKEIEEFLIRKSTDDPFDLDAADDPWKPSTVATYRRYLKRYFGLLVTLGHAPDDLRHLRDLVPIERAQAALKLMKAQNDGDGRVGASHIARLLSQVANEAAKQKTEISDDERASLSTHASALRKQADRLHKRNKEGMGERNRERLLKFRDEANLARLFLLPFALAKELQKCAKPTRGEALSMQWALALMILTFCPLRISSLCHLRIDRHLVWTRPGMKGELRLKFARRELKNDAPEILPLPPECARLVRIYLERFRPKLCPNSSPFLFPGSVPDKCKQRGVLTDQIQTLIFKRTGFEVNPHLYRHLVHIVILTRFPGAYAMISRVLTHRSLDTARKNYAYFDTELSMNSYHKLIRGVIEGSATQATVSQTAYDIDREAMRDGKR